MRQRSVPSVGAHPPKVAWITTALAVLLLIWSRTAGLAVGFWNDEAFSVLYFIEKGPTEIFLGAGVPAEFSLNNHRLFSLLAWASVKVLGESEASYRLWSIVPGIVAAGLIVWWVTTRVGPWEGVILAVLALTAPLHAELTGQARGYGLGFLAEALILTGSDQVVRQRSAIGYMLLGIGGWIGTWTLPVFVVPFVAQSFVILLTGRRAAVIVVGMVGLATLAFYWPVLAALASASGQEFGRPIAWHDVLSGAARDLFAPSLWMIQPRIPEKLRWLTYACLLALAARELWRRRETTLFWLLTVPVAVTYAALAAYSAYSVPRYVSYLLFHVLVLMAVGAVATVRLAARLHRGLAAAVIGALLAFTYGMVERLAYTDDQRASLPIEAYREAVAAARSVDPPFVVTDSRFGAGFQYYGRDLPLRFEHGDALQATLCSGSAPFVFIHYPLFGWPTDVRCLENRTTSTRKIPQLTGDTDQQMTVFFVWR